ncbi:MAG: hypothetical protein ACHBNF_14550 [Chromatiales bacterium]
MKRKILLLLSIVYLLTVYLPKTSMAASISLPQTGQTNCFDSIGQEISCEGTGQDAELRKGTSWPNPRFTDNGDGTITDNLTGLMWLKDANCAATIGHDPDASGNGSMSWLNALDFVKGITKEALQKCREQAQMREAAERVARHIR